MFAAYCHRHTDRDGHPSHPWQHRVLLNSAAAGVAFWARKWSRGQQQQPGCFPFSPSVLVPFCVLPLFFWTFCDPRALEDDHSPTGRHQMPCPGVGEGPSQTTQCEWRRFPRPLPIWLTKTMTFWVPNTCDWQMLSFSFLPILNSAKITLEPLFSSSSSRQFISPMHNIPEALILHWDTCPLLHLLANWFSPLFQTLQWFSFRVVLDVDSLWKRIFKFYFKSTWPCRSKATSTSSCNNVHFVLRVRFIWCPHVEARPFTECRRGPQTRRPVTRRQSYVALWRWARVFKYPWLPIPLSS